MNTSPQKLQALRALMHRHELDAYVIPSSDAHQSEYVANHWKTREWISGFSGSTGTVVVTASHAGLWTDSRYFLQAAEELKDSGVALHKLGIPHTAEHLDWMLEQLPHGSRIGFDGRQFSAGQVRQMARQLAAKEVVLETNLDLVGQIWTDRPPLPSLPVFDHHIQYAGVSREQKLQRVREKIGEADACLITTLDDIAWLFNLRGSDVECNPVFYAYAVVGRERAWLFVHPQKITDPLRQQLHQAGVLLKPYEEISDFLAGITAGVYISADKHSINQQLFSILTDERIVEGGNPPAALKAIKNETEIKHLKNAMVKDGVALVRLFRWLEEQLRQETPVTEASLADQLTRLRQEQELAMGDSFFAIVGYGANGAIVHYKPEHGTCAQIKPSGILLLDSGGQYLDGTTDITRTVALGEPTPQQKSDFTLVLKGHIALADAAFPKGTTGIQLDTLARLPLWQQQMNYGHGTGHGVGFFLNVHEGPHGIGSVSNSRSNTPLVPGMVTSNEPGIYREGSHGMRTENLILCVERGEGEFGIFYAFETISLFPIDSKLLDHNLLLPREIEWLNDYHATVYAQLAPFLTKEEADWLAGQCRPI
jgi:Xaa-Pro aminopeptidase